MNIIKSIRESKGISIDTIANKLQLTRDDYIFYEDHYDTIDMHLCENICDILGVDFNCI